MFPVALSTTICLVIVLPGVALELAALYKIALVLGSFAVNTRDSAMPTPFLTDPPGATSSSFDEPMDIRSVRSVPLVNSNVQRLAILSPNRAKGSLIESFQAFLAQAGGFRLKASAFEAATADNTATNAVARTKFAFVFVMIILLLLRFRATE
jgi:hypothetical protein